MIFKPFFYIAAGNWGIVVVGNAERALGENLEIRGGKVDEF